MKVTLESGWARGKDWWESVEEQVGVVEVEERRPNSKVTLMSASDLTWWWLKVGQ